MQQNDILLKLFDKKVEAKGKKCLWKDPVLGCIIDVTKEVRNLREDGLVEEESLTLTTDGREAVIEILSERLKKK